MDKVIEILDDLKNDLKEVIGEDDRYCDEWGSEITKAIAELTAYKAALDGLKEWCFRAKINTSLDNYTGGLSAKEEGMYLGKNEAYADILQKLEELQK